MGRDGFDTNSSLTPFATGKLQSGTLMGGKLTYPANFLPGAGSIMAVVAIMDTLL